MKAASRLFAATSKHCCLPAGTSKTPYRQLRAINRYQTITAKRFLSNTMATVAVSTPTNPAPQPQDASAKKHHRREGKGFINPWDSYTDMRLWDIMRWILLGKITGERKDVDTTPPTVPVHKPDFLPTRQTETLRATWLGHACFYVEFPGGLRVLFDPVFTQRCSPFSFMGPARYTDMPCQIEDIPYVDAVVISHNHYDHLSRSYTYAIMQPHQHIPLTVFL